MSETLDSASQVIGTQKVACSLGIARRDRTVFFKSGKEIFDQVAGPGVQRVTDLFKNTVRNLCRQKWLGFALHTDFDKPFPLKFGMDALHCIGSCLDKNTSDFITLAGNNAPNCFSARDSKIVSCSQSIGKAKPRAAPSNENCRDCCARRAHSRSEVGRITRLELTLERLNLVGRSLDLSNISPDKITKVRQ